jgi:hypothetical protein
VRNYREYMMFHITVHVLIGKAKDEVYVDGDPERLLPFQYAGSSSIQCVARCYTLVVDRSVSKEANLGGSRWRRLVDRL